MNLLQYLKSIEGPFPPENSNEASSDVVLNSEQDIIPEKREINLGLLGWGENSFYVNFYNPTEIDVVLNDLRVVNNLTNAQISKCEFVESFNVLLPRMCSKIGIKITNDQVKDGFHSLTMYFMTRNGTSVDVRVNFALNGNCAKSLKINKEPSVYIDKKYIKEKRIFQVDFEGMLTHAEIMVVTGLYEKESISTDSISLIIDSEMNSTPALMNDYSTAVFKKNLTPENLLFRIASKEGNCFNFPLSRTSVLASNMTINYYFYQFTNLCKVYFDPELSIQSVNNGTDVKLNDISYANIFHYSLLPFSISQKVSHRINFRVSNKNFILDLTRDHSKSILEPIKILSKYPSPMIISNTQYLTLPLSVQVVGEGEFTLLLASAFVKSEEKIKQLEYKNFREGIVNTTFELDIKSAFRSRQTNIEIPVIFNLMDGRVIKKMITIYLLANKFRDSVNGLLTGVKIYCNQRFTEKIKLEPDAKLKIQNIYLLRGEHHYDRENPLKAGNSVYLNDNVAITKLDSNSIQLEIYSNTFNSEIDNFFDLRFLISSPGADYIHRIVLDYTVIVAQLSYSVNLIDSERSIFQVEISNVSNSEARIFSTKAIFGVLWQYEGIGNNEDNIIPPGESIYLKIRIASFLKKVKNKIVTVNYNNKIPLIIELKV